MVHNADSGVTISGNAVTVTNPPNANGDQGMVI